MDFVIPTHNYTVDWYNGEPGGYGPTFDITGLDFSNPANYNYRGFYEARQRPHGDDWQGRLDFEYTPRGIDFLSKIQWGVRYVDRNASDQFGDRYAYAGDLRIPISAVPLTYVLYPSGFRGDNHAPTPITWLGPTFDSVWANMMQLRQFDVTNDIAADTNDPAINPTSRFNINEKSYAGYGQLNFKVGDGRDLRRRNPRIAGGPHEGGYRGLLVDQAPPAAPSRRARGLPEELYGLAPQREYQRPLRKGLAAASRCYQDPHAPDLPAAQPTPRARR